MKIKALFKQMENDAAAAKVLYEQLKEKERPDAREVTATYLRETKRWSEDTIEAEMEDW